jgi:dihydrofolate reductase
MTKVILSITMSLDGYVAGPGISQENPMGIDGQLLHRWVFDDKQREDEEILSDLLDNSGAVIMGSTTYKTAIDGVWGSRSPFGAPVLVLSSGFLPVVQGFTLVNDGIESALAKAQVVAKAKNILIMGGAHVAQQYLYAGLLNEINIQIAPLVLGSGTRLFRSGTADKIDLIHLRTIQTKGATHLKFGIQNNFVQ